VLDHVKHRGEEKREHLIHVNASLDGRRLWLIESRGKKEFGGERGFGRKMNVRRLNGPEEIQISCKSSQKSEFLGWKKIVSVKESTLDLLKREERNSDKECLQYGGRD